MSLFSSLIARGTRAAQPAATSLPAGSLYYVTDESKIERSSGSAWEAFSAAAGGSSVLVQHVNTQSGAVATGTTTIPFDDTIPQITEGTEFITRAITPTNAANILEIDVTVFLTSTATPWLIAALFQDATANALAAIALFNNLSTAGGMVTFRHRMVAGTTSSTTFRVRCGPSSAATITFNGQSGGRIFGGVMASSITIKELTP